MSEKKDRVKNGRSRVSVIIDDVLVEILDELTDIERRSRAQLINILLIDALERRGLSLDIIQDDHKRQELIEKWQEKGFGAFSTYHEENISEERQNILHWFYRSHIRLLNNEGEMVGAISRNDALRIGADGDPWEFHELNVDEDSKAELLAYCDTSKL